MVAKYQRPVGSYAGAGGLANRTKYQDDGAAVPKRAISSAKVDGDINYVVDGLNELDAALLDASLSGAVPGQAGHAGKYLTTNGSTLTWDALDGSELPESSVALSKIANGTANRLVGYGAAGAAGEVVVGSGLSLSAGTLGVTLVGVPTGVVAPFAGAVAPSGWMLCDGAAVSRTTYAGLFAALGTVYGVGDGSTTFNVPDMRGRAVFGVDSMGGSAASRVTSAVSGIAGATLGASGGSQALHAHTHTVTDPGHVHGMVRDASGYAGGGGGAPVNGVANGAALNTGSAVTGISVASTGTGASQNMPPAMMMNYIVKA